MKQRFRPASLVPAGLMVDGITIEGDRVVVRTRSAVSACPCPDCGAFSQRIQSRYFRRAKDLPLSGRRVELQVLVRRFRCDAVLCGRQIFAERFGDRVLAPRARRTDRLDHIVQHLGLALGGRPGASFAARMMLPVSNDTLLRVVRQRARVPSEPLRVIGIDDFAWRRNHRYGTIVCDLERRRPVALLCDREPATSEAWLRHQRLWAKSSIQEIDRCTPGRPSCLSPQAGAGKFLPFVRLLTRSEMEKEGVNIPNLEGDQQGYDRCHAVPEGRSKERRNPRQVLRQFWTAKGHIKSPALCEKDSSSIYPSVRSFFERLSLKPVTHRVGGCAPTFVACPLKDRPQFRWRQSGCLGAGQPVESSPGEPPDEVRDPLIRQPIALRFTNHDRLEAPIELRRQSPAVLRVQVEQAQRRITLALGDRTQHQVLGCPRHQHRRDVSPFRQSCGNIWPPAVRDLADRGLDPLCLLRASVELLRGASSLVQQRQADKGKLARSAVVGSLHEPFALIRAEVIFGRLGGR
ncbi:MAG: hypothetical protein DI537_40865 [Stutzerimonas stutzeri]|nr:MAG: hypothetical protein DI537_40865 [Stutzerimonas stutzeri]